MTPTQRTLKHLRDAGYTAAVVERWNPHAKVRQDLFGVVDVLAVGKEGTIAVQATSLSNVSARVKKIGESDTIGAIREAGWRVLVHGWGKDAKGEIRLREVDIS